MNASKRPGSSKPARFSTLLGETTATFATA